MPEEHQQNIFFSTTSITLHTSLVCICVFGGYSANTYTCLAHVSTTVYNQRNNLHKFLNESSIWIVSDITMFFIFICIICIINVIYVINLVKNTLLII